jgi:hypothetical protein
MTSNEQLCCDREHAKLLAETGLMGDVEADGYWTSFCNGFRIEEFSGKTLFRERPYESGMAQNYKTYRLDKILTMLPEWVWDKGLDLYGYLVSKILSDIKIDRLRYEISELRFTLNSSYFRGQSAANAAAKLLHLLWEEKLI